MGVALAADTEDELGAGVITAEEVSMEEVSTEVVGAGVGSTMDEVTAEEVLGGLAGVAEGGMEVAGIVGPGAGAANSEPTQTHARMSRVVRNAAFLREPSSHGQQQDGFSCHSTYSKKRYEFWQAIW